MASSWRGRSPSCGLAHPPGILLMTHAGLAQVAVPADSPHISGVLTKPVHQSHLFDAIVGVLSASKGKLPYKYNPVRASGCSRRRCASCWRKTTW